MDAYERLRATAITMIVRDIPLAFWSDLRALAIIAYADVFADVDADKNILTSQKIDDLLQRRHFRMEKLIVDLAIRHGLSHSTSVIPQNSRHHAYVFNGDDPENAFIMRNIYGLIAHNPIGRRFHVEEQKLGMIQFCLPASDCRAWAVEFTVTEILEAYPAAPKRDVPKRSMPWKKPKDDEGTGTDSKK
jgi:hypothetical protein